MVRDIPASAFVMGAAHGAFQGPAHRDAAAATLLMTAAGLVFYGISGAFRGLLVGGVVHALRRPRREGVQRGRRARRVEA